MYLVYKQYVIGFERSENSRQVSRLVKNRPTGNLKSYSKLVGDDITKRCLAQARRTIEQGMVKRLPAVFGSLNKNLKVLHYLLLTVEVSKTQWAKSVLKFLLALTKPLLMYVKVFCHMSFEVVFLLISGCKDTAKR